MSLESTLTRLRTQVETAIAYYGDSDAEPPMHLLEMQSYFGVSQQAALLKIIADRLRDLNLTAESATLDPTIINRTLDQANTETPITLFSVRLLEIYCRNNITLRYAFEPGRVQGETPVGPYRTLPPGISQPINLPAGTDWTGTIYLSADTDGAVVEVEAWSVATWQ